MWVADGLFRSEEEIDNSAWYGTRPNVGDIKYRDLNGDGFINVGENRVGNSGDRRIIGNSAPRYLYGINLGSNSAPFHTGFICDFEIYIFG